MRALLVLFVAVLCVPGFSNVFAEGETQHRIGGGVNYLRTVGDIEDDDDFDENALSFIASWQCHTAGLLAFELAGEYVPDFGGSDEALIQPQAYLLVGGAIYAGVGIGIGYIDGDWQDEPFYALRAGLDLEVAPGVFLDINANYRFQDSEVLDSLDDEDLDAVMLGAQIRIAI